MIKVVLCGIPTNETADETTGPHGSVETKYLLSELRQLILASRHTTPL